MNWSLIICWRKQQQTLLVHAHVGWCKERKKHKKDQHVMITTRNQQGDLSCSLQAVWVSLIAAIVQRRYPNISNNEATPKHKEEYWDLCQCALIATMHTEHKKRCWNHWYDINTCKSSALKGRKLFRLELMHDATILDKMLNKYIYTTRQFLTFLTWFYIDWMKRRIHQMW